MNNIAKIYDDRVLTNFKVLLKIILQFSFDYLKDVGMIPIIESGRNYEFQLEMNFQRYPIFRIANTLPL